MSKKTKEKKFTWETLRKIANSIPEDRIKDEVIIWTDRDDDASAFAVKCVERLSEDYIFDGDEGCAPRSIMKETIEEEKAAGTYSEQEFRVILHKGQRILYAE